MTKAYSPQAKGRIERLWETPQSRLVIEFKINGINTIEAANAFLPAFIEKYGGLLLSQKCLQLPIESLKWFVLFF